MHSHKIETGPSNIPAIEPNRDVVEAPKVRFRITAATIIELPRETAQDLQQKHNEADCWNLLVENVEGGFDNTHLTTDILPK